MKGAKSMSIQTEITRLQGLRNTLRAALVALGLAQSAADLETVSPPWRVLRTMGPSPGPLPTRPRLIMSPPATTMAREL